MLYDDLEPVDLEFVNTLIPDTEMIDQMVVLIRSLNEDGEPTFRTWVASDGHVDMLLGMMDLAHAKLLHDYGMHEQWVRDADDDD